MGGVQKVGKGCIMGWQVYQSVARHLITIATTKVLKHVTINVTKDCHTQNETKGVGGLSLHKYTLYM